MGVIVWPSQHRADIESLRAVAILGVVAYHASSALVPGGFAGVDVFFVLSGFLITQILLQERDANGRVQLTEFWARRSRRILPAASVMLVATALVSALTLSPLDLRNAYGDIIGAALYVLNWRLASHAVDYLAQNDMASVVLHCWSLSVEEQFYIFWPLVIWGAVYVSIRRSPGVSQNRQALIGLMVSLWIISFVINLITTRVSAPYAFFGTPSRVWQLLTGGLLAVGAWSIPTYSRPIAGWVGLAMIGASFLLFSRSTVYPGAAALLPVMGTAAIILADVRQLPRSFLARFFELRTLRYFGGISYSWYLWHWPFLVLGAAAFGGVSSAERLGLVLASLCVAIATHHFIENPIRFAPLLVNSPSRSLYAGAGFTLATILAAAVVAFVANGAKIRLHDGTAITLKQLKNDLARTYSDGCHLDFTETISPPCAYGNGGGARTAVLFGDSHAAQWFPALEAAATKLGWKLLSRTKSACPAIDVKIWDDDRNREYTECAEWRRSVVAEIRAIKPESVFISNFSVDHAVQLGNEPKLRPLEHGSALALGEQRLLEDLARSAGKIFVLRDLPGYRLEPARCLFDHPGNENLCAIPLDTTPNGLYPTANLTSLAPIVKVVDLAESVCRNNVCPAARDGVIVMRDNNHLTASFARTLAVEFERMLAESALNRPF